MSEFGCFFRSVTQFMSLEMWWVFCFIRAPHEIAVQQCGGCLFRSVTQFLGWRGSIYLLHCESCNAISACSWLLGFGCTFYSHFFFFGNCFLGFFRVIQFVSLEVLWVFCFIRAPHEIAVQQCGAMSEFMSSEAFRRVSFKSALIDIAHKCRHAHPCRLICSWPCHEY